MKRKIAVVAPTSVVARNYISHLGDRCEIVTVGRRDSDIIFDLLKDNELRLSKGLDSVIDFAGVLHANSAGEICNMIAANISGVIKICDAAIKSGAGQLILISSISATLPVDSLYYSYYSLTKRQGEELASLYCKKNGLKLCIIRPSQLFGSDPEYGKTQPLLYLMIKNALENKPIKIYGRHDAKRNYIYAENLFRVIDEAVERKSGDTIDVISPNNITLSEMAKIIVKSVDSSSEITFLYNEPNIEDNAFYMDVDIFKKWNLLYENFEQAIESTLKRRVI